MSLLLLLWENTGCSGNWHVINCMVCMVALNKTASVSIQNMSKIDNLVMVAKEIIGCYGEILVAMNTDMLSRDVHDRYPQTTISYFSKYMYAENRQFISGC